MTQLKLIKAGFHFGAGVTLAVFTLLSAASLVSGLITPHDTCDGPDQRCGMRVLTDHKTGLQYLETPGGGLYPRMTVDGEQMREAE